MPFVDVAGVPVHYVEHEQPELFGALVHEWLDRVEEVDADQPAGHRTRTSTQTSR